MESLSIYRSLPTFTGVYLFLNKESNVIYVGKATNLKKRVASYFTTKNLGKKTKILVNQINSVKTIGVSSELEAFLLEERLIKKYKPRYNIKLTDGKSFPSVKITVKDNYPKVLIVRKEIKDKSIYFGPYKSAADLKIVLKIVRRLFPFQSVINHPKTYCFYYHLGLCPCPEVTSDKNYGKNINHIIDFFNGDSKKIIKDLEKERDAFASQEEFENASLIQNKINIIIQVTSPFYRPFEYELNPNLRSDVIDSQMNDLKLILEKNNIKIYDNLKRIECYDISNISGKYATGSMVVITNGEKDTASYRRFKIKNNYKKIPNDFAMMQEVLERRLKHKEWQIPSLIVVDGGKGQVSAAKKVLENTNNKIPLIGLAKKEEIIITDSLNEIRLPKNSTSLQIIMRIRDEAHRFAITYHKKLRSKFIFS